MLFIYECSHTGSESISHSAKTGMINTGRCQYQLYRTLGCTPTRDGSLSLYPSYRVEQFYVCIVKHSRKRYFQMYIAEREYPILSIVVTGETISRIESRGWKGRNRNWCECTFTIF